MKPVVDGLVQDYRGKVDIAVYADLNGDPRAAVFATQHGVEAVPTLVLVGEQGQELERWVGAVADDRLRASLDAVQELEGQ